MGCGCRLCNDVLLSRHHTLYAIHPMRTRRTTEAKWSRTAPAAEVGVVIGAFASSLDDAVLMG
jgi:hypothetical protein